jgi:hypothetical protein
MDASFSDAGELVQPCAAVRELALTTGVVAGATDANTGVVVVLLEGMAAPL